MATNQIAELRVADRSFPFQLARKRERLGSVRVDHWWIDRRRLYGQRGRSAATGTAIVDCFWALCEHHESADEPPVQESYILARLLRNTRSNGARKIFLDSHVDRSHDREGKARAAQQLEDLLRSTRQEQLTPLDFKARTADTLGPPRLDPAVKDLYIEFTSEFLGEARSALAAQGNDGLDVAARRWQETMAKWSRRGGLALEKQVLDILSYEAKAAFHRCYSAVWCELIAHLHAEHSLDDPTIRFLSFWHLDQLLDPIPDVPASQHLFHGHVFGLHPVGSDVIRTLTGRELIGAWLEAPDDVAAYQRVLHAMHIGTHAYALRRDEKAEERSARGRSLSATGDTVGFESKPGRVNRRRRNRQSDF